MGMTSTTLKKTPFHDLHTDRGARFVDFAGWEMPLHYGSIIEEHHRVRKGSGFFDVSHMGRIRIGGRHARKFLEHVMTRRVSDMKEKTCRYSFICGADGGVIDDVVVYRFADDWLVVCNASNREAVMKHLHEAVGERTVKIEDETETTAMIAVQGPKTMDIVGKFSSEVPTLKNWSFCMKNLLILKMSISRTGYTGEDGIEIILGAKMAPMAVKLLLKENADADQSIAPTGLGARDTLRIEAGLPLYGHELRRDLNPLASGMTFAVSMDKPTPEGEPEPFIGHTALAKIAESGPDQQLVGLLVQGRRTPRQGMSVQRDGQAIGEITSGCMSPTLDQPIAMAYVKRDSCAAGDAVQVVLGSTTVDTQVTTLPFYRRPK